MENNRSYCNSKMSIMLKAANQERRLKINVDHLEGKDFDPLLKILRNNNNLHTIIIKSDKSENQRREPEVKKAFSKQRIMDKLVDSLAICMKNSDALTQVELQSLPLTTDHVSKLSAGIEDCRSLQNLLLTRLTLFDESIEIIYKSLCSHRGLTHLDFTNCKLTTRAAYTIAKLIKMQRITRYDESWKQSLRHREPNKKILSGIRRITLNDNPGIGDEGFISIIHELMDDFWLKALDAQNCGLTDRSASESIHLLKVNNVISIIDIRRNSDIRDLLNVSIRQLISDRKRSKKREPAVRQPGQTGSMIGGSKQSYDWLEIQSKITKPHQPIRPDNLKPVDSIELLENPPHTSSYSRLTEHMQRTQISDLKYSLRQERKKFEKEEQEKNFYKKKLSEKFSKDWEKTKQLQKKISTLQNQLHAYASESQIPKKPQKPQSKSFIPSHIVKPKLTNPSIQARTPKTRPKTCKPSSSSKPKIPKLVSNPQGPINSFQSAAAVHGQKLCSNKKSKYENQSQSKRAKTNKSTKQSKPTISPQKEPSIFEFKGCDENVERFTEDYDMQNFKMKQYFKNAQDFENNQNFGFEHDYEYDQTFGFEQVFENDPDFEMERDFEDDDLPEEDLGEFANDNTYQLQQMQDTFPKFDLRLARSETQDSSQPQSIRSSLAESYDIDEELAYS